MDRKTILIDGFNMGLETGTGVATYARNLTYCVHDLGYETDVLYDTRQVPGGRKFPLLREISFFDPNVSRPPPKVALWLRNAVEAFTSFGGSEAKRIPITGKVIATHYKSKLPYADNIWNSPNIFNRAERHFFVSELLYPSRLRVTVPKRPHIAHWTYPLPMRIPGAINIYTMHDLVPLRLPFTTLDNKRLYYALMRMLARKADHIVTVSETSKKDIINLLGVPEDRVTNTYQSVEIPAKYADKPDDVVKREIEGTFNVNYKEYILFFGAIEPKKNVARLIEAYLGAKIDTPLLLVGKKAWKAAQELRMIEDEEESTVKDANVYLEQIGSLTYHRQKIYHVDYAPFPLLVSLIRGAKAVVFPSLYEGFGLPILEAMKLGTPVITSNEGATPEVAGNGAILIDPYDTRALADAICAVDSDANLRQKLSVTGRAQAEVFSADAYKQRLGEMYDRLLTEKAKRGASTRQLEALQARPAFDYAATKGAISAVDGERELASGIGQE